MSNWASLYYSYSAGMTDYITRHNSNYARIETCLNYLYALSGGAPTLLDVPYGLRQIFDRKGVIGKTSYKPTAATLTGPNYNLTVTAGAGWFPSGDEYRYKNSSTTISMSGRSTDTYYIKIDSSGEPSVSDTADSYTLWQFSYDSGTHVVSAVALYSGVTILFDGDDYADCLTSTALAMSFESIADRFEEIEELLGISGVLSYYAEDADSHSGLNFYYKAGKVRNDNTIWNTSADYVTLANNTTNYIEVDPADGTVSANTSGFTTERIPLFTVVTSGGAIDTVTEQRTWASAGGGGGGGGHTQNTDLGTNSAIFTLLYGTTGTPSSNATLAVERGDDPNVAIRWNETTNYWEYTNDGTNYKKLGEPDVDMGAQYNNKYEALTTPEKVFEDLARDTSADWEDIDLTAYITAMNGAAAVQVLVQFWDDAPGSAVNVQMKPGGYVGFPPLNVWTVWDGQYDLQEMILEVDETTPIISLFVNASGTGTANVRVYLIGYFSNVVGVGTQEKEFTETGLDVAASTTEDFELTGFMNRGLVHYFKVEETGGLVTGTYDLHLYDADGGNLLYKLEGVDPSTAFEDAMPFFVKDANLLSKMYLRIINDDGTQQGTYSITVRAEQFN